MINILLAIAPIFFLIVLGHALRRGNIPSLEFWNLNDKLVYWVLFPPLLFFKMATMELSDQSFGQLAVMVYVGFGAALLFAIVIGSVLNFDKPLHTSIIQGSARHNTFIALAVAEAIFGEAGLFTASIITALLIPITNLSVVSLMIIALRGGEPKGVFRVIVKELMRNPILLAVFFGWLVNISGIEHIPVVFDVCQILGAAALPIVLLCVGANIRIRAMAASALPVMASMAGKLIVFPAGIAIAGLALRLDPQTILLGTHGRRRLLIGETNGWRRSSHGSHRDRANRSFIFNHASNLAGNGAFSGRIDLTPKFSSKGCLQSIIGVVRPHRMTKKKSKPNKKARAKKKSKPTAASANAPAENSMSRRTLLKYAGGAAAVVVGGFGIHRYDVNKKQLHDLSVIGQGQPVVVQVHDPSCQLCRRLMSSTKTALETKPEITYRVANLNTKEGREIGQQFGVGKVTLLLFNPDGEHVHTVQGVTPVEQLERTFDHFFNV